MNVKSLTTPVIKVQLFTMPTEKKALRLASEQAISEVRRAILTWSYTTDVWEDK